MMNLLFDDSLLDDVFPSQVVATLNKYEGLANDLKTHLRMRPLAYNDFEKGYLSLISEGEGENADVDKRAIFTDYFNTLKAVPDTFYVVVIEDVRVNQIAAAGTLIIEQKFIHATAMRGRIENLIVLGRFRRKGLGSLLLQTLSGLSRKLGCYKTTLNCSQELKGFCQGLGYLDEQGQNFMLASLNEAGMFRVNTDK